MYYFSLEFRPNHPAQVRVMSRRVKIRARDANIAAIMKNIWDIFIIMVTAGLI